MISAPIKISLEALSERGKNIRAVLENNNFKSPDLTYLEGVFVTSGANNNGDVFLPSEMLKALVTPINKPININHKVDEKESMLGQNRIGFNLTNDTNTIVGTIYDALFVHEKTGKILAASEYEKASEIFDLATIDDNFLDPANKYHIIIAGVLWKFIFPKTIADVIDDIQKNNMALSMESYFSDFDFLVNNEVKKRDPQIEAAYNAKLRIGGKSIGRVVRNPLFGAVGLTENPANPSAFNYITVTAEQLLNPVLGLNFASAELKKIENKENNFSGGEEITESNKKVYGESNMEKLEAQIALIDERTKKWDEKIVAQATEIQIKASRIVELEQSETKIKDQLAKVETAKAEIEKKIVDQTVLQEEIQKLKAQITEKDTEITTLKTETEKIKVLEARAQEAEQKLEIAAKEKIAATRIQDLVSKDIKLDTDTEKTIASLSDDEFKAIVESRTKLAEQIKAKASLESEQPMYPFLNTTEAKVTKILASGEEQLTTAQKWALV